MHTFGKFRYEEITRKKLGVHMCAPPAGKCVHGSKKGPDYAHLG